MEYIPKKDKRIVNAREEFEHGILPKVRKYLKEDFGKREWVFQEFLVGSTKRNLVLVGNEGYDLDYQLRFDRMPDKYLKDARATKDLFRKYFNRAKAEFGLTDCEDSTHVLTMKRVVNQRIEYSYDIAILRLDLAGQYIILKKDKKGQSNDYHYVPLPDCSDFREKIKQIRTAQAWAILRDKYKAKKEKYQSVKCDERPASFSLLGQAVNEFLQKSK